MKGANLFPGRAAGRVNNGGGGGRRPLPSGDCVGGKPPSAGLSRWKPRPGAGRGHLARSGCAPRATQRHPAPADQSKRRRRRTLASLLPRAQPAGYLCRPARALAGGEVPCVAPPLPEPRPSSSQAPLGAALQKPVRSSDRKGRKQLVPAAAAGPAARAPLQASRHGRKAAAAAAGQLAAAVARLRCCGFGGGPCWGEPALDLPRKPTGTRSEACLFYHCQTPSPALAPLMAVGTSL
ncbi:translation initiation factor IF-2-like [Sphaerodactylus townsendi]|uniref:translation initiation factor IF-2-like n=1 Tax=Sphaerodactylus townsendi TaxID=933632 RepID=UPI002027648C|nr:translation initiation factor IF-2-like [Sphaerodactylus townsendi]